MGAGLEEIIEEWVVDRIESYRLQIEEIRAVKLRRKIKC